MTLPRLEVQRTAVIIPYERFVEIRDRRRRVSIEFMSPSSGARVHIAPEPLPTVDCVALEASNPIR